MMRVERQSAIATPHVGFKVHVQLWEKKCSKKKVKTLILLFIMVYVHESSVHQT